MEWRRMLAFITGTVDQELLLRNEYLATENRILRSLIGGRPRLTDPQRIALAKIGKKLGRKVLEEIATIVRPDTILSWHRKLIARKFDGSKHRRGPGRPRMDRDVENLVVRLAQENRAWGYDRIVGALTNLGHTVSDQTVGNILKHHGITPAPKRRTETTWQEFIRSHLDVLCGTDFFTVEVWTAWGLVTYYVLFFIHLGSRKVQLAGVTPHPNESWMKQIARNATMADWGFLLQCRYLLLDRDKKFSSAFHAMLRSAGIRPVILPARSPNLNAFSERWVRSVKEECLSRLILFGERSLQRALREYLSHYHHERNHQGKDNLLLFPQPCNQGDGDAEKILRRDRLGGLLNYYYRSAA